MNPSSVQNTILDCIRCPISRDIMREPVTASDGQTYERSAIVSWLANHNTSPITNEIISSNDLRVNPSIRFLIDKYLEGQFGSVDEDEDVGGVGSKSGNSNSSYENIRLKSKIGRLDNSVMFTFDIDKNLAGGFGACNVERMPQDLIVIVDRSGSMGMNVAAKDENGKIMEDGFSQLDLVLYACRTMGATLNEKDRMCVISFDDRIIVEFNLIEMSKINFNSLTETLNKINPRGSTNIWQAIQTGLNIINERDDKSRNSHIVLLTDGSPNTGTPARGEIESLSKIHDRINFSTSINTIGFGYNLQDGLLSGISQVANGVTSHIPEGTMIATVFNHLTANILSTVAMNLQLNVRLNNGYEFDKNPVYGDFKYKMVSDDNKSELVINVGTVQWEQVRNVIINVKKGCQSAFELGDSLLYFYSYKIGGNTYTSDIVEMSNGVMSNENIERELARNYIIDSIKNAISAKERENMASNGKKTAKMIFDEMCIYLDGMMTDDGDTDDGDTNTCIINGMNDTLRDQIYKALSIQVGHEAYFKKWGLYYLQQLVSHLNSQRRPNFRDMACKSFGGDLFNELVDFGSDCFNELSPPVPSNTPVVYNRGMAGGAGQNNGGLAPLPFVRLNTYNSQSLSGPCFDGDSHVTLSDGNLKRIRDLCKGDKLLTLYDHQVLSELTETELVCVLKTKIEKNLLEMTELPNYKMGGSFITDWHPVLSNGIWMPAKMIRGGKQRHIVCDYIYSLVLKDKHVVFVNDYPCITLGHNYSTIGLKHNYLGTNRIINDLKLMCGWDDGEIEITEMDVKRDEMGLICRIDNVSPVFL